MVTQNVQPCTCKSPRDIITDICALPQAQASNRNKEFIMIQTGWTFLIFHHLSRAPPLAPRRRPRRQSGAI